VDGRHITSTLMSEISRLDIDALSSVLVHLDDASSVACATRVCRFWTAVVGTDPAVRRPVARLVELLRHTKTAVTRELAQLKTSPGYFFFDYSLGLCYKRNFDSPWDLTQLEKQRHETELREEQGAAWLAKRRRCTITASIS